MTPDDPLDTATPTAMSVTEGLQKFGSCLTPYEKEEIKTYTSVYYGGQSCTNKVEAPTTGPNNGYDGAEGEYVVHAADHIAYRYEILEELGKGAFGQVLKAIDHKDDTVVAVKLIRNQKKVLQQAAHEVRILEQVNQRDPNNRFGIVRMIESFSFRGHTCISYELLGKNLYEYLQDRDFYPMPLSVIRAIAARMLISLTFFARENIMHCDLKPENILLQNIDPSEVKLVDLGSASEDATNSYMYIQSRFYRAPEIILEAKYNKSIDWWSFGCILCELANGDPLFPGDDEKDQLGAIMEYLGPLPEQLINAASSRRRRQFFDGQLQPRPLPRRKGEIRVPGSKSLAKFLGVEEEDDFLSFVRQFLQWDPTQRVPPREAMRHRWISEEFVFPTKPDTTPIPPAAATTSSPAAEESTTNAAPPPAAAPATTSDPVSDAAPRKSRADSMPEPNGRMPATLPLTAPEAAPAAEEEERGGSRSQRETRPAAHSTGTTESARRHPPNAARRRQRRSTEMTAVEVPGGGSNSATLASLETSNHLGKGQSQLAPLQSLCPPSLTNLSLLGPSGGGNVHARRQSVQTVPVLAFSPNGTASGGPSTESSPRLGLGRGVIVSIDPPSPDPVEVDNVRSPFHAEGRTRELALLPRPVEMASGVAGPHTEQRRSLADDSLRSGGSGAPAGGFVTAVPGSSFPHFTHLSSAGTGTTTDRELSTQESPLQSRLQLNPPEPKPSTPVRRERRKIKPEGRREYSLNLDATLTSSTVNGIFGAMRAAGTTPATGAGVPRALLGMGDYRRGSRERNTAALPLPPAAAATQARTVATEEVQHSGEAPVVASSHGTSVSTCPDASITTAPASAAPAAPMVPLRGVRGTAQGSASHSAPATVPSYTFCRRSTRNGAEGQTAVDGATKPSHTIPSATTNGNDNGSFDRRGSDGSPKLRPSGGGTGWIGGGRFVNQRQPLTQRPRQSTLTTLSESKSTANSSTFLPPLKGNTAQ